MGDVPARVQDVRSVEVGGTTVGATMRLSGAIARARLARGMGSIIGAAEASALKEIRDAKLYKGMPRKVVAELSGAPAEDLEGACHTFEDFCDAVGRTRQRVYERIASFETFGDELGHVDELGIPRALLRLAGKVSGDGRRELLKLARDPATDRAKLVNTIAALAREAGALEAEKAGLEEALAEKDSQIEAGKAQLKKLSGQVRELKGVVADWKAGRAMPEEDRAEMNEFAQRCAEVKGFFLRLSTYGWGNGKGGRGKSESPLAGGFGALVMDTALQYLESLSDVHGLPQLSDRRLSQIKRLAEAGHLAADAVAETE